jgi:hypothetical protein
LRSFEIVRFAISRNWTRKRIAGSRLRSRLVAASVLSVEL